MSRIGKQPILIPKQINVTIDNNLIVVKGLKGTLSFKIPSEILIEIKEKSTLEDCATHNKQVFICPKDTNLSNIPSKVRALWGLTRAIIANNIEGVLKGHKKELEIKGIGYRARIQNKKLVLLVGFSHPVEMDISDDLDCSVKKNIITIIGVDKQKVGQFAAQIREIKKPEPYKGKGIRYLGETVKIKQGKKATSK